MLDFVTFITFHNKCISLRPICQEIFACFRVFFMYNSTPEKSFLIIVEFEHIDCCENLYIAVMPLGFPRTYST